MRRWRRRWCAWRNHPIAEWAPIVTYYQAPATLNPDWTITPGTEYMRKAYRCERHDRIGL